LEFESIPALVDEPFAYGVVVEVNTVVAADVEERLVAAVVAEKAAVDVADVEEERAAVVVDVEENAVADVDEEKAVEVALVEPSESCPEGAASKFLETGKPEKKLKGLTFELATIDFQANNITVANE
jgi:hypothetical protein